MLSQPTSRCPSKFLSHLGLNHRETCVPTPYQYQSYRRRETRNSFDDTLNECFNSSQLKIGAKLSPSANRNRSSPSNQINNNLNSETIPSENSDINTSIECNRSSNSISSSINASINIPINDTNNNTSSDGNNNNLLFEPVHARSEQQMTSNESDSNLSAANHNSSFMTESKTNESSSSNETSAEKACFTTTSSSSSSSTSSSTHRHSIQRQITTSSEVKVSCVQSNLSDIKSSLSELKDLDISNPGFRKSIENILLQNDSNEPLVTYPESPTPSASGSSIATFPCSVSGSRKNSVSIIEDFPGGNYERRLSTTSKTKLLSEQFIEQQQVASSARQLNNAISEKSLDSKLEQRKMSAEDFGRQESQNRGNSSTMRLQGDSFSTSAEKKGLAAQQQMQTIGKYNHIAHRSSNFSTSKNFSTSVSHSSQSSNNANNFIKNEINSTLLLAKQNSLEEFLSETFDDLNTLRVNASPQDVEKAIIKYSGRLLDTIETLRDPKFKTEVPSVLDKLSEMMSKAWLIPKHGHELGHKLCDELRKCGGLDVLISNCDSKDDAVKFCSAKLLEQCLTTENRAYVVDNGLEKVVHGICTKKNVTVDHSRVSTGILSHLFKHSETTCEHVIRLGGLDSVLFQGRKNDLETLRHCASALANLSLYGGAENQEAMIKHNVPMWLFPLAFHDDDNVKYYACLAIAVLVANKEIESEVLKSGTLNLVEPFVTSHNPSEFAKSNLSHAHGQSQNWLEKLVPVLSSKREEARNLAAFHFCMEAGIKKSQGNTKIFSEIGAIDCLKKVASCPNAIASKFAAQALRLIGEAVPHKLIQQVPLWSVEDVKQWVIQIGFAEYSNNFEESRVDGDLLLQLTEDNLKDDIGIRNGIRRTRFTRELHILKKMADYSSRDANNLNGFLQNIGSEFSVYTYSMLNAGVNKDNLRFLSEEQLLKECRIVNSIHRLRLVEAIKSENNFVNTFQQDSGKPLDVFISYRRSNGSQLASLLKVHLQVRNFSVFIDVEKLEAGKFDNNLLQSIKQARNFILVLTPNALERCVRDVECKDWVHREIVAALENKCNIIPITDNFQWPQPEALPEDMRAICHFNGIKWIHDYQDACVEKLERFLRGEVNSKFFGQDLSPVTSHGRNALIKNEHRRSPPHNYQRTMSNDSNKDCDSGFKE